MNAKSQDEMEIDLLEMFGVLMSRLWLIVLVGVLFAVLPECFVNLL